MTTAPAKRLDGLVFGVFALTLLWAPIPFASNRPWASALLAALLAAALLLYVITWARGGAPLASQRLRQARLPFVLLLLLNVWICLQLLPLPASWVSWLSPQAAAWRLSTQWQPLSLDPAATRWYLVKSAIVMLGFTLTVLHATSRKRIKLLLAIIIASGTLQAIYGCFMVLSGLEWGFLVEKYVNKGQATGTFINRNHFAGYMALCLGAGLALIIARSSAGGLSIRHSQLREWLQRLLGSGLTLQVCMAILLVGLIMSRSRMGVAAALVALLTAIALVTARRYWSPKRVALLFAAAVCLALALGWLALPILTADGAAPELASESRFWTLQYALRMLQDFPVTGSGGGSFYGLFPNYQGLEVTRFHRHAHNDYLEFGIELGLPALALMASLVTWCLWHGYFLLWNASRLQRGIGACTVMICTWAGLHSLVDFNLQIPANSLTLITLLALVPAAAGLAAKKPSHPSLSKR